MNHDPDKKALFVLPYYDPFKDEGAKKRMLMFMEIAAGNGFQIHAVAGVHASIYLKAIKHKEVFEKNYSWTILPFFGLFRNALFHKITRFLFRVAINNLCRENRFAYIQAETTAGGYLAIGENEIPVLVDYHGDILDETLCVDPTLDKASWKYKTVLDVIRKTAEKCGHAIFVSTKMQELLLKQTGIDLKNNVIFPCVAEGNQQSSGDCPEFRNRIQNRIVLSYLGGLQPWQNVDRILDIVIELRKLDKRVFFALFTPHDTGIYQEKLDWIGAENYYIKSLSKSEVQTYFSHVDVSFLLRDDRPLNRVSSPTKIRESLALGIPVIGTKYSGDIESIVRHDYNGFILSDVTPQKDEIPALYDFISRVASQKEAFKSRCVESVMDQDQKHFEEKYMEYINTQFQPHGHA